jgi:hypothetical protein
MSITIRDHMVTCQERVELGRNRGVAKQPTHPQAEIDWTTAAVSGGTLTVELAGDAVAKWTKALAEVIERLDRGGTAWGAIAVKRGHVVVDDVRAGAEADLRHLLEAGVAQVNADFAPPPGQREGHSEVDDAMTAAFRAFAPDAVDAA